MEDMLTTEYDGCGRCLVAVRRLSRKSDDTSSPQRQGTRTLRQQPTLGLSCQSATVRTPMSRCLAKSLLLGRSAACNAHAVCPVHPVTTSITRRPQATGR